MATPAKVTTTAPKPKKKVMEETPEYLALKARFDRAISNQQKRSAYRAFLSAKLTPPAEILAQVRPGWNSPLQSHVSGGRKRVVEPLKRTSETAWIRRGLRKEGYTYTGVTICGDKLYRVKYSKPVLMSQELVEAVLGLADFE
jgi:hypothetical protein